MAHFSTEFLDPTLPAVTLQIGGKVRKLAFSYEAIVVAEKVTGVNMLTGAFDASFTTLAGLLYAALLQDNPELTLQQVGSWIHFRNAPVVYQAILSAWMGSMPLPEDVEPGEAEAQPASAD